MKAAWLLTVLPIVALASGASAESENTLFRILGLPGSIRPLAHEPRLRANHCNAVRSVVKLAESAGVEQIAELARRAVFEEQWAYLPDRDLWVEIGFDEKATDECTQVATDVVYLSQLVTAFGRVHIYHFHPHRYFAARSTKGEVHPGFVPANALPDDELEAVGFSLPSMGDIVTSIQIAALDEIQVGKIEHYLVSPYGAVTYGPTERGRRLLRNEHGPLSGNFALKFAVLTLAVTSRSNIKKTVRELGDPTITEVIAELCGQLSGRDYELRFRPRR
jgi:hypothetical protein